MNKEVKIMTTIKELQSFCKKNKIKCVKDKEKKDCLCLTIPPYMDTMSQITYQNNFKYEIDYFITRFIITVYDRYLDDFNDVKEIYSWNNRQDQILGVLFLRHEYVIFTKSEKKTWDDTKWFYFNQFRGEQQND